MKNNIISKHQFGFLKIIGTKDALNCIINFLYRNFNHSKLTLVAFLDLAKAFDTIDHQILLDKLDSLGIRGQTLDLLSSYIGNRYQAVRIDDKNSDYIILLKQGYRKVLS